MACFGCPELRSIEDKTVDGTGLEGWFCVKHDSWVAIFALCSENEPFTGYVCQHPEG